MRAWSEVVVEQVIFGDVCRRYRPNIRMGRLKEVHPDLIQAVLGVIKKLFDDACRYMAGHSQPLETLSA